MTLQQRIEKVEAMPDTQMFYWASYSYASNCPNFWAKGSAGYTTDIDNAEVYTKEQTLEQLKCDRAQDVFYPIESVQDAIYRSVDSQKIKTRI